ncbi:AraC family transcriptional regulator [Alcaligenaceae bacterium]|nr:AraC family transcriptional regulator [Alcaligenaceae bacterium]
MTFTHHTIAIDQVLRTLSGLKRAGFKIEPALRRSGISPALLESPLSRVSHGQYAALIRVLRKMTRDELWGLCSRPVPIGAFAQCCHLAVNCSNLGEAMLVGFRYYRMLLSDFTPRLSVDNGQAQVRLLGRTQSDPCQDYAERTFCFFTVGLGAWLVGRRIPILSVNLRSSTLVDTERLFLAPVSGTAPDTGFVFDARWLELPVVQNGRSLQQFLKQLPDNLLIRYRDPTSIKERIRRLLRAHPNSTMPTLENVGVMLAMAPQTLRRRLRTEGQSFQRLKDEMRRDAAIQYLMKSNLTLVQVADLVGFSEASTFHRAFKKWTGVSPGEYRHQQQGQESA